MFLRIVRVRSTEQSGIIGVKIPFDPNIIIFQYNDNYKDKEKFSCPYRGNEQHAVYRGKYGRYQKWMQKKGNAMKP